MFKVNDVVRHIKDYRVGVITSVHPQTEDGETFCTISYFDGGNDPKVNVIDIDAYKAHLPFAKQWRMQLDTREQKEIQFATMYSNSFDHGTAGHNRLKLIAKLAGLLDSMELHRGHIAADVMKQLANSVVRTVEADDDEIPF